MVLEAILEAVLASRSEFPFPVKLTRDPQEIMQGYTDW